MEKEEQRQQEGFDLDRYREVWQQQGAEWRNHPLMTDEEILAAVEAASPKAAPHRWGWAAVAAAALLVGVCATVMYLGNDVPEGATLAQQTTETPAAQTTEAATIHIAETITGVNHQEKVRQDTYAQVTHQPKHIAETPQHAVATVETAVTEVTCNSLCDSSAVLGQIRSFLLDKEV